MDIADSPEVTLLLSIDCLRADIVDEMPTLSKLRDDHLSVSDCHCVGSGTPTSMPGLMQSRLPTDHGGQPKASALVQDVPTLAEILSQNGIETAGWHSNLYTSREYDYHRGFDIFADLQSDPPTRSGSGEQDSSSTASERSFKDYAESFSRKLGLEEMAKAMYHTLRNVGLVNPTPSVPADQITDATLSWLPESPHTGQKFAWAHYMDLHNPYVPPRKYREVVEGCPVRRRDIWPLNETVNQNPQDLSDSQGDQLKKLYIAAARYVDDQIDRIISELQRRDLWQRTQLIITADHGELFNDRGIPDDIPFKHPNYLCEELTRVPLVIAGANVEEAELTHVASGMDVPATILDTLGIDQPESWSGVPIGSPGFKDREYVLSVTGRGTRQDNTVGELDEDLLHVALRTDETAVLWWSAKQPTEWYTRTDSGEKRIDTPRDTTYTDVIEADFEAAADRLAGRFDTGEAELSSASRDRLRELGYIN